MNTVIKTKHNGFTLIELAITLVITGFISTFVGAAYVQYTSIAQQLTKKERLAEMVAIKDTILTFAANDNNGRLPSFYAGDDFNSACIDETNTVLSSYLSLVTSIPINLINTDQSIIDNVRVCQAIRNLTYQQSISGFNGPTVTLTYDRGVAYQTQCAKADSTCNTGIPGDSNTFATSWTLGGSDTLAIQFSTLGIAQSMWNISYDNLLYLRDVMSAYRVELVRTNAADDASNWNIAPNLVGSPNYSTTNAATNQGCYDGWYDLNDEDTNVLPLYGINQDIFSITQSGAIIEYCRDYDLGNIGANTVPHIAALRINRTVSTGVNPSTTNVTDNLIISF